MAQGTYLKILMEKKSHSKVHPDYGYKTNFFFKGGMTKHSRFKVEMRSKYLENKV